MKCKTRKFDVGGTVNNATNASTTAVNNAAANSAVVRGNAANPMSTFRQGLNNMYRDVRQDRRDYAVGSPERQNYKNYMQSLPDRHTLMQQARDTGKYTLPTLAAYDPKKAYAAPVKGKGMAKGGSVGASKRGDGIAQRGKTKGRMV